MDHIFVAADAGLSLAVMVHIFVAADAGLGLP